MSRAGRAKWRLRWWLLLALLDGKGIDKEHEEAVSTPPFASLLLSRTLSLLARLLARPSHAPAGSPQHIGHIGLFVAVGITIGHGWIGPKQCKGNIGGVYGLAGPLAGLEFGVAAPLPSALFPRPTPTHILTTLPQPSRLISTTVFTSKAQTTPLPLQLTPQALHTPHPPQPPPYHSFQLSDEVEGTPPSTHHSF